MAHAEDERDEDSRIICSDHYYYNGLTNALLKQ